MRPAIVRKRVEKNAGGSAVVAAFGAVQGLFAAAPEPVAEPAKRGLFALFGR